MELAWYATRSTNEGRTEAVSDEEPRSVSRIAEQGNAVTPVDPVDPKTARLAVDELSPHHRADITSLVTQAIAAQRLDADGACARLARASVDAQLPPNSSPEHRAALRRFVSALIADDPVLRRLLTTVGNE